MTTTHHISNSPLSNKTQAFTDTQMCDKCVTLSKLEIKASPKFTSKAFLLNQFLLK